MEEPSPAFPDAPVIPGASAPSYAARLKRRRSSAGWIIPVLLGTVLLGAFGIYWKMTEVTATGPLPCTVLPADHALQITLDVTEHGVPAATARTVIEHLREQPASLVTDLMITEFSGNGRGLQITLSPGVNGRLVRVPILKNRAVADFYADNLEALDKVRRSELDTAVQQFCEIWANATQAGMNPRELSDFRNRLALTALVRGLGYHVNAVIGRRRYPCVHEDADSRLHFMLPHDTSEFEIVARPFEDRRPVLPEPFEFEVRVPAEEPEPAADDGADEADTSPDDAESVEEATEAPAEEEQDGATMSAADDSGDDDGSMSPPGMSPPEGNRDPE
ncbi:hypothetical protein Mal4_02080 [Maioricimonas rarisocia]|uniref:Uncharacterized protein n=2 Tax=Maioricimonas rarisocia TaxID=2528026 RepID=A0A517Z0B8_9PLAN|nr:hypothetical protein Mal4_02080 [Maioricimonas rarisocia]